MATAVYSFISYKYNILIYTLYTRIALYHIHNSGKHRNKRQLTILKTKCSGGFESVLAALLKTLKLWMTVQKPVL